MNCHHTFVLLFVAGLSVVSAQFPRVCLKNATSENSSGSGLCCPSPAGELYLLILFGSLIYEPILLYTYS